MCPKLRYILDLFSGIFISFVFEPASYNCTLNKLLLHELDEKRFVLDI